MGSRGPRTSSAYDKAAWHIEGDFPAGLDVVQASVHTGFFIAWAIQRDLVGDAVSPSLVKAVKARTKTGVDVYVKADAVFDKDMLSAEGNAFAKHYYAKTYLSDYAEVLAGKLPTLYHVANTWKSFDAIAKRLDERYRAFVGDAPAAGPSSAVAGRIKRLRAKAKSAGPEDVLPFASLEDASAIAPLRAYAEEHWSAKAKPGKDVPMRAWVDAVCAYLEGGYDQLRKHAGRAPSFALAVLEELATEEAASTALAIARDTKERDTLFGAVDTLNLLLSFKPAFVFPEAQCKKARDLLHARLSEKLTESQASSVYCALRGVGDDESIALLQGRGDLKGAYKGMLANAVKAIKKRKR